MNLRLAGYVEHTLLRADATHEDVERLCREATDHGLFGVCVAPVHVETARRSVGDGVRVVTVAGFPLGSSTTAVKVLEARTAVGDGASEVDMVMALWAARAGDWDVVEADIRAVRDAIKSAPLKVILETGLLDQAAMQRAAVAAVAAGADFVKTSTGYGPRGASVEDVVVLRDALAGRAHIKASGGIRTAEQARALIDAGATRIGTSNGVAIAAG